MSLCKHAKRAVDNDDALVCNVCSIVQDKNGGGGGGFTKPLNWGIMALKSLMELSGQSLWSVHK